MTNKDYNISDVNDIHGESKNDKLHKMSEAIKAEARRLGFFSCGIAKAEPVEGEERETYLKRVDKHCFADMDYMYRNVEKRLDPTLLVPGTKSIISVAMNYAPSASQNEGGYKFAAYALGHDYHIVIKERLRTLASTFQWDKENCRVFVDTAPVLERYWAMKAGLGWIGKNDLLIIPHAGTMFFLGEIFVDIELEYDKPIESRCGRCHRCIDNCPTHALSTNPFDAQLCLSYQLIENRGELSEGAKKAMGDTIYGCDRCQQSCPWNRFSTPTTEPEFQPNEELLDMRKNDWLNLDVEKYRKLFKGSAVKRAKYSGLMRNIEAASENEDTSL